MNLQQVAPSCHFTPSVWTPLCGPFIRQPRFLQDATYFLPQLMLHALGLPRTLLIPYSTAKSVLLIGLRQSATRTRPLQAS